MAVVPIARVFLPCAHVERRESDDSFVLVNPLDSVNLPTGVTRNFLLGPIYFYVQLKEGLGTFFVRVEVKNENGRRLAKSRPKELVFSEQNRNSAEELVFKLANVHVDVPGLIQFELFANEKLIASWEMRIFNAGD